MTGWFLGSFLDSLGKGDNGINSWNTLEPSKCQVSNSYLFRKISESLSDLFNKNVQEAGKMAHWLKVFALQI